MAFCLGAVSLINEKRISFSEIPLITPKSSPLQSKSTFIFNSEIITFFSFTKYADYFLLNFFRFTE